MTQNLPAESIDNPPSTERPTVSISKALELRSKGLTYDEVGKVLGFTKQAIQQRIAPFISAIDNVTTSQAQSAELWTVIRDSALNSLTPEDYQKASLLQKVTAAGISDDKYRRAADLSTANVNIMASIHTDITGIDKEIAELEAMSIEPDSDE